MRLLSSPDDGARSGARSYVQLSTPILKIALDILSAFDKLR